MRTAHEYITTHSINPVMVCLLYLEQAYVNV